MMGTRGNWGGMRGGACLDFDGRIRLLCLMDVKMEESPAPLYDFSSNRVMTAQRLRVASGGKRNVSAQGIK